MNCPVCKTIQLVMSERQGVEVDYCPQCRGVWLDRGELDKIIERSLTEARPSDSYQRETHYDRHDERHHDLRGGHDYHKKKNFLSELFD